MEVLLVVLFLDIILCIKTNERQPSDYIRKSSLLFAGTSKASLRGGEPRPKPAPLMRPADENGLVKDKGVCTGRRGTNSYIEREATTVHVRRS